MSERKNSKSRRNYLVKCSCPNCTQESEHSFSRVQKGALLICPHCNKGKRTARAVLTGMCYSSGSAMRHGSSSLTRLTGQSAMTPSTWRR